MRTELVQKEKKNKYQETKNLLLPNEIYGNPWRGHTTPAQLEIILECLLVAWPWRESGSGKPKQNSKDKISIFLPVEFKFHLRFLNLKKYFIHFPFVEELRGTDTFQPIKNILLQQPIPLQTRSTPPVLMSS